jgi:hypothetical protein
MKIKRENEMNWLSIITSINDYNEQSLIYTTFTSYDNCLQLVTEKVNVTNYWITWSASND